MYIIALLSFYQARSEVIFEFPPGICLVSLEWVGRVKLNELKGEQ